MELPKPWAGSVLLMVAECVTANNDSPALAQKLAEFLLTPQAQAAALASMRCGRIGIRGGTSRWSAEKGLALDRAAASDQVALPSARALA